METTTTSSSTSTTSTSSSTSSTTTISLEIMVGESISIKEMRVETEEFTPLGIDYSGSN